MKRRFALLRVHQKLVVLAIALVTAALVLAMTTLIVTEFFRYRQISVTDATALATVLAENTRAAIAFDDAPGARDTLETVRVRQQVMYACLYTDDRALFEGYVRDAHAACAPSLPALDAPAKLAAIVPVTNGSVLVGYVYVERDWSTWWDRLRAMVTTSVVVLAVVIGLTLILANRLHRLVSTPIVEVAAAARRLGHDGRYEMPAVAAPPDELGDLVQAFGAMVGRVRDTNVDLQRANESLRHEIEERRRMESEREGLLVREREANRLKDEFLATVSHELRTPLNAIVGWTAVLAAGRPDEATFARAVGSLQRNAQAQTHVIDDLIDISSIVMGKLRMRFEPLDLRTVVEAAAEAIRPAVDRKRVRLDLAQPATPCRVVGDGNRLQQIIWNLLSNATKFTPAEGTIALSLVPEGDTFRITVQDSGIGIASAMLPHVFERFRQADASTTREHAGLGIGLAIVKELTELHGGTIRAASPGRDQGATFTITLPRADERVAATLTARDAEPLPSLAGVRVLAVDDNADALHVLEVALAEAGAEVRTALSGRDALVAWSERPSDVLLCDLSMPHMSGYDLLTRIREIDGAVGRVTPAIAITAQATGDHAMRSARAGFQLHVTKPFDPALVIRGIAAALERV